MQFSIKTVLAIAISMTTLASAAPAEAAAAAAGYKCCAFDTCTTCADNGRPVFNCAFCDQEPFGYCCRY